MSSSRKQIIAVLQNKYPDIKLESAELFEGREEQEDGGIWVQSVEDRNLCKNGLPMFDYYANGNEDKYDLGVNVEMIDLLDKHGWYAEWNDPGTIFLYKE
jgi:hypothetical protein